MHDHSDLHPSPSSDSQRTAATEPPPLPSQPRRHIRPRALARGALISTIALPLAFLVLQSAAVASTAGSGEPPSDPSNLEGLLSEPFLSAAVESDDAATEKQIAVLTRQGLSRALALHALALQQRVSSARLPVKVEAALEGSFAGMWFDNATPQLHIGVTSAQSRRTAEGVVARAGLDDDVTITTVRSTWAELIAVQGEWSKTLAGLVAKGEAMSGLDAEHNAIGITLSSSVPAATRAELERRAARESVNVSVNVVPSSEFRPERAAVTCKEPFASFKAFCEKTITSGVTIVWKVINKGKGKSHKNKTLDGFAEATLANVKITDKVEGPGIPAATTVTAKPTKTSIEISNAATKEEEAEFTIRREAFCTAGPMLIKGFETYMVSAGHCYGEVVTPAGGEAVNVEVISEYPAVAGEKEVGKEVKRFFLETDLTETKVKRPGAFTEALPIPVPALMTEWKASPKVPHAVNGSEANVEKQMNCHEGQTTGEECGTVGKVDVEVLGTKHLVEDTACAEGGDSGGPFFMREEPAKNILMQGVAVIANTVKKCAEGEKGTWYEPFQPLPGVAGSGVLGTFPKQRLLRTANEARRPRVRRAGGASLIKKVFAGTSGATTIETIGGSQLTCTADTATGEASAESAGTTKLTLTGCQAFGEKCRTAGAAEGEIALSASYKLAYTNGAEDEVGLVLEITEATIECGAKNCEGKVPETLKLRGAGIGAATPINEEVVPAKKFTLAFAQTKGVQKPTEYEKEEGAKVKAILELSGAGTKAFAFEQAGLASSEELLFEESAEIEA
jgi:hypothetical protein